MDTVVTARLFQAYLECSTKCVRKSRNEPEETGSYSAWLGARDKAYCDAYIEHVPACISSPEDSRTPLRFLNDKKADWGFLTGLTARTQGLESAIQLLERSCSHSERLNDSLIPIRFSSLNKISKRLRLLATFDAFALSKAIGRSVHVAKVVHGDPAVVTKVKVDSLQPEVVRRLSEIAGFFRRPTLLRSGQEDNVLNANLRIAACKKQLCVTTLSCSQASLKRRGISSVTEAFALSRICPTRSGHVVGQGAFPANQNDIIAV